jgi:hypothetical protein
MCPVALKGQLCKVICQEVSLSSDVIFIYKSQDVNFSYKSQDVNTQNVETFNTDVTHINFAYE